MNLPANIHKRNMSLTSALGKIRVLSVGVSEYACDFSELKQSKTDAEAVANAFRDVIQLNGDRDHISYMSDLTLGNLPNRGSILLKLQNLASGAEENDRILFYFSGHGTRLTNSDDFYLVPMDVYSGDDAGALISMQKVYAIMEGSRAKQKIVILDACLSGPTLNGPKHRAAAFSDDFFAKQLQDTKGFVVLSSSTSNQKSYTKSDNPKLSLFTFYLLKGLWGDVNAIDSDKILTMSTLFDYVRTAVERKAATYNNKLQTPSLYSNATGTLVLGDFRRQLISGAPVDLPSGVFDGIILVETESESVRAFLPEWKNPKLTQEQLEYAANTTNALANYFDRDFSAWRTKLRNEFGFAPSGIGSEGGELTFPGGSLCNEYKAESKERGVIIRKLHLEMDWCENGERLRSLLEILKFGVEEIVLSLNVRLTPIDQLQGLTANGWVIQSEKDTKVVASKAGVKLRVYQKRIAISGLDFDELFDASVGASKSRDILSQAVTALALA